MNEYTNVILYLKITYTLLLTVKHKKQIHLAADSETQETNLTITLHERSKTRAL